MKVSKLIALAAFLVLWIIADGASAEQDIPMTASSKPPPPLDSAPAGHPPARDCA